jgi:YbbR domain-containing protein
MKKFLDAIAGMMQKSDTIAKVVCLIFAAALWMYVANSKKGEVTFRVPVEFRGLPASAVLVKRQFKSVTIVLSGKNEDVKGIDVKSIRAFVNLETAAPGDNIHYPVEITRAQVPDTVHVDLSHKRVLLSIEQRAYRKVPVIPKISGNTAEGYALGAIRAYPDFVTISGSGSRLAKIDSIATRKVPVDGLNRKTVREAILDADSLDDVTVDIQKVTLAINVLESAGLIKVETRANIRAAGEKFEYMLLDGKVQVYFKPLLDGTVVSADDIEAFVDVVHPEAEPALGEPGSHIEKALPVTVVFRNRAKRDAARIVQAVPDTVIVKILRK